MARIEIMYENGCVWQCDTSGIGEGDVGKVVACSEAVWVRGGRLLYAAWVLPWNGTRWRKPLAVTKEWSSSTTDFIQSGKQRIESKDGSMRTERMKALEQYPQTFYTLRTNKQLENALSITVNGVLAYVREDGELVPAARIGMEDNEPEATTSETSEDKR